MMPFVGYPLPHVQSMADLQRQEMEGIPIAPPCGCRPHWIGPDAFGQWHAPVRCLVHSSASGAYHGNTFLKQQQAHQQSMVSGFPTPVYPQVIPGHHRPSPVYPRPSPTPPPPPRPSVQASPPVISNDSRALTKEPTSSPPTSIRSNSSKRRSKPQSNNVSSRGFRPHSRRNRPEETTSSEGDYFSAGASDEENGDDPRMSRSKARNRGHRIKDGSWECEHCTFINRPDTRICNMCCKTTGRTTDTEKRRTKSRSSPLANGSQQISVSPGSPPTMHQSSSARILDSSTAIERQSKDDGEYEDLENKTDLENDKVKASPFLAVF